MADVPMPAAERTASAETARVRRRRPGSLRAGGRGFVVGLASGSVGLAGGFAVAAMTLSAPVSGSVSAAGILESNAAASYTATGVVSQSLAQCDVGVLNGAMALTMNAEPLMEDETASCQFEATMTVQNAAERLTYGVTDVRLRGLPRGWSYTVDSTNGLIALFTITAVPGKAASDITGEVLVAGTRR